MSARVVGATWQRCRVHFMRNALAHVLKGHTTMVAAAIRQVFLQPNHAAAAQSWRHVAGQLRARSGRSWGDDAEADVLAYMTFPAQHRSELQSTDEIDKPYSVRGIALRPNFGAPLLADLAVLAAVKVLHTLRGSPMLERRHYAVAWAIGSCRLR